MTFLLVKLFDVKQMPLLVTASGAGNIFLDVSETNGLTNITKYSIVTPSHGMDARSSLWSWCLSDAMALAGQMELMTMMNNNRKFRFYVLLTATLLLSLASSSNDKEEKRGITVIKHG